MIWYTCKRELLPVVEAMLAANGYTIANEFRHGTSQLTIIAMQYGIATVLLVDFHQSADAEIEVHGTAQSAVALLLERSPIELQKRPSPSLHDLQRPDGQASSQCSYAGCQGTIGTVSTHAATTPWPGQIGQITMLKHGEIPGCLVGNPGISAGRWCAIAQQIVVMKGARNRRQSLSVLFDMLLTAGKLDAAVSTTQLASGLTLSAFVNNVNYWLKSALLLEIADLLLDRLDLLRADERF